MVSFLKVSPEQPSMDSSSAPYVPHVLPISYSDHQKYRSLSSSLCHYVQSPLFLALGHIYVPKHQIRPSNIHPFRCLPCDSSVASSKTSSPHYFVFHVFPLRKVIQVIISPSLKCLFPIINQLPPSNRELKKYSRFFHVFVTDCRYYVVWHNVFTKFC